MHERYCATVAVTEETIFEPTKIAALVSVDSAVVNKGPMEAAVVKDHVTIEPADRLSFAIKDRLHSFPFLY